MSAPLWTSDEAAAATGGTATGSWRVDGVSIDTRSLKPGDLFVALKDVRDGHDFLDAAYAAGAGAALVSRGHEGDRPALLVGDTLAGLEALSRAARARTSAHCAAVTGSVGKTSVKEMLARIYRAVGAAHWSDKSFNNHWGVPLTLARMPAATERAIFEIGMNTPNEIAPRSRMVRPHLAMITRIAPAHLEGMGTVENVADEKCDIVAGLEPGGAVILPADDALFHHMWTRVTALQPRAEMFAFSGWPVVRGAQALDWKTDGARTRIDIKVLGETVSVELNAVGAHWAINAALALLAAKLAGVPATQAAEALSGYAPPAGRGVAEDLALPDGGRFTLVDDSYNANPESMRAALLAFAQRPGRRIVALGEMRELGPDGPQMHAGLADAVRACDPALVVLVGEAMAPLANALSEPVRNETGVIRASSVNEAVLNIKNFVRNGDLVLIKGSNASGMGRVGSALRNLGEAASVKAETGSARATGADDAV